MTQAQVQAVRRRLRGRKKPRPALTKDAFAKAGKKGGKK